MTAALWPVFIASKGRPSTVRVPSDVPASIVVEPQETDQYQQQHPDRSYLVLPENDQGLAYVRNWIHQQVVQRGHSWYWMLDDDISAYYRVDNRRCVRCEPTEAFLAAQRLAEQYPMVGQVALEYQQIAWSATKPAFNGYADVCVANCAALTGRLKYRDAVVMKEDRDFTLQVLAAGLWTLRTTRYAFGAPTNGSNAGGLEPLYATTGREQQAAEALAKLWPGIVKVERKRNGRVDAIINWRAFRQKVPA